MKQFAKMVLAVICGLIIMTIIGFMMLGSMIAGLSSESGAKPVLARSGILKIDMSEFVLSEQENEDFDLSALTSGAAQTPKLSLWRAAQALKTAAEDPTVKYIYLKPDGTTSSIAALEEFRAMLDDFRKSGKAIVSYTENPTLGSYYLASVSDKVYMTSYCAASPMIHGISVQNIYLADLLKQFGVNVQLIRHGKYKSAGEMFVRNAPSAENQHQTSEMVNSIWDSYISEICSSREISKDKFNSLVDNLQLRTAGDLKENGLVDELMDRAELLRKLADLAGIEDEKGLKAIPFTEYAKSKVYASFKAKNQIAVIYADGDIIDDNKPTDISGDRFVSILEEVRNNDNIKAVVFRVNSPGGSAFASEKIRAEIERLRAEKPVIASYGSYAASGGYWISNSCDHIFTDKTTLTGSIGVFSMIPDISKTLRDKLHVNVVTTNSNAAGNPLDITKPLNDKEREYIQALIEDIYENFVTIVAEGRNMDKAKVDELGQGRVWTGAQAIEIGLADEIGGLTDALLFAAEAAGDSNIESWGIQSYPRPMTKMEAFASMLEHATNDNVLAGTPYETIAKMALKWNSETQRNHAFARMTEDYFFVK